ncbi:MAG: ATP-binding cassette domain-containing protein [Eggerthellaceae bacterium]
MRASDVLLVFLLLLASTLLGMLLPQANQMLFGPVLASRQASFLPNALALLFGVVVAQALLNAMKTMVLNGVGRRLALDVESAAMMRLLSLPATFFKGNSAGELANLMTVFSSVAVMIQTALLGTVISAVFSLVYLVQIFAISPALGVPALAVVVLNSAVCLLSMLLQTRLEKRKTVLRAKLEGWQASLLQNVRTIRLTASEERAFATWAKRYAAVLRVEYNGPFVVRLVPCVQLAIVLIGTVAVYTGAVGAQVPASRFMAFNCAFGMLMGVHLGLSQAAGALAKARSQLAVLEPLTCQVSEKGPGTGQDHEPSGDIELRDLRFSYSCDGPEILSGLDLHIHQGEFLGVVGESGCGKSTLARLLLGFEHAPRGSVLFDGKDIEDLDIHALRRHFGVVLQDTQLFKGDILSNIVISAPWLSEDDAWKAAEAAGVNAVLITGGEPLLHRDFREIVSGIYGRGMFVHEINTNGSLLDRETLAFLKGFGDPPDLKISFDGLGYHDWMRACPGAEKAALRALELSVEEGFPVCVQMNVNRKNRGSIVTSLCLLDGMGVERTRLICTTESPRWELNARGQTMDWPEYLQFCADTFASYAEGDYQMKLSAWRVASLDPSRRRYRLDPVRYDSERFKESRPCCPTIKGMPAIGADGNVYPCMQCSGWFDGHGIRLGNVFEQGLGRVLRDGDHARMVCHTVGDRLEHQKRICRKAGDGPWPCSCADCRWLTWCAGGCPALAMLASGGDFLAPDVFTCEFFNGGWPERIARALPGWTCQNPLR